GFRMLTFIPRDNWEHKVSDLFRGLVAALGPEKQNMMLDVPGLGSCVPVKSGRAALVTALRALNLPLGARVGVPLYCCPVVFSAMAIFSFRSGKYLSVGEGGALLSHHADAGSRASELISAMRTPGRAEECAHVTGCYLKSVLRSRPFYGIVGYALWNRWNKNR